MEKRAYAPGQHGQSGKRRKVSDYGVQLREKQKLKRIYGLRETQFKINVKEAIRLTGVTGENLLRLLELRLDNVVYRLGLAASRNQARQFVNHGHILVNGKKVDIPSYHLRVNETVEVIDAAKKFKPIVAAVEASGGKGIPSWLSFDVNNLKGGVVNAPNRDDIDTDIQESLIVEYYSR
jgi:small subunit ribosomal protein S4